MGFGSESNCRRDLIARKGRPLVAELLAALSPVHVDYTSALSRNPNRSTDDMPHFFRDPEGKMTDILQLDRQPLVGEGSNKGTCVELAKFYAAGLEGRSTKNWEAGERVIDLATIRPGVAIATFIEKDGKLVYPGWDTGNHFAFSVRVSGIQNGKIQELVVMDQFKHNRGLARGSYIATRHIAIQSTTKRTRDGNIEMSNDLRYFYIIK